MLSDVSTRYLFLEFLPLVRQGAELGGGVPRLVQQLSTTQQSVQLYIHTSYIVIPLKFYETTIK